MHVHKSNLSNPRIAKVITSAVLAFNCDLCNYLSTQGNDFKSHKRNHNGETTTVEKHDPESARIGERLKTSAVQLSANSAMYKGTTLWFVCSSGKKHNFRTCGEGRAHWSQLRQGCHRLVIAPSSTQVMQSFVFGAMCIDKLIKLSFTWNLSRQNTFLSIVIFPGNGFVAKNFREFYTELALREEMEKEEWCSK